MGACIQESMSCDENVLKLSPTAWMHACRHCVPILHIRVLRLSWNRQILKSIYSLNSWTISTGGIRLITVWFDHRLIRVFCLYNYGKWSEWSQFFPFWKLGSISEESLINLGSISDHSVKVSFHKTITMQNVTKEIIENLGWDSLNCSRNIWIEKRDNWKYWQGFNQF